MNSMSTTPKQPPLYQAWRRIRAVCNHRSHPQFHLYGERGIISYEDWDNYEIFREWAIENGWDESAPTRTQSILRYDENDDFCPDNCYVHRKNPR